VLRRRSADQALISDYQLVVSELASNVIEHGDGSEMVVVVDSADPQWWAVEVSDGPLVAPFELTPDTWKVADPREFSGRGLGIVRELMDDIVIGVVGGHVSVRCRRHRRPPHLQEALT
jgi:anti-sigma regulatory factor (Ser/Thr protein kinase)